MPRIDNSNQEVIEEYNLEFDESEPGRTEPVDLCWECYHSEGYDWEVEHPPYQNDDIYFCSLCKSKLEEDDNDA